MSRESLTRREVLTLLGAAGLGCRFQGTPGPRSPFSALGVQLYTLRELAQRDLPGTLKALAEIGYREVETHSYYGRSPADVRKALDDAGLRAPAAHIGLPQLQRDLPAALAACTTIGHRWLIVPSLQLGSGQRTADAYKRVGEQLAAVAAATQQAGVRIGFHNHAEEFAPVDGTTGMDLILANSPADAVFAELDVYWIVRAGGDPLGFLERQRGRVKMLHLKDSGGAPQHEMRDVGAGTIDWTRIMSAAQRDGIEHVFVEHDRPGDALASVRASYMHLSRLGMPRGSR
jgi:sugar phosphate isomerase/epimerase